MATIRLLILIQVVSRFAYVRSQQLTTRDMPSWSFQGCYTDIVSNRTFAYLSGVSGSNLTTEACTSDCGARGYEYAGTEYGTECYCDNALDATKQAASSDCSVPCSGSTTSETCGNGNRLSVYKSNAPKPSTNPGPAGWNYLACYTDSVSSRLLRIGINAAGSGGLTVAQCTSACGAAGYAFAGVEYGQECYCDMTLQRTATVASSGCSTPCGGNFSELCGGSNRLNIYQAMAVSPPTSTPANWLSLGCFVDDVGARTLRYGQQFAGGASNMTVEGCLSVCKSQGYNFGSLEYSQECFCDTALQNGGACASDQSTCDMPCNGRPSSELCGGSNRINIYVSGSTSSTAPCSSANPPASSSVTTAVTSRTSSSITISHSSTFTTSSTTMNIPQGSSTSRPQTSSATTTTTTTTTSTTTSASPTGTGCPSYWTSIVADLAPLFRVSGQCTDMARAAIRYAFHDAATFSKSLPFYAPAAGGADGSLLLSPDEIGRPDNNGLHAYHAQLTQKYSQYQSAGYGMSASDLIQISGALGVVACPGGRSGTVLVGRSDTNVSAPDGVLPQAFGTGSDHDTIFALFTDKGFTARDLAALVGAHTTGKANFETQNGIPAGTPQDSTPGLWDFAYYNETYFPPPGIGRFDSDINLSQNVSSAVGRQFKSMVGNQGAWSASFQSAYKTLSLLRVPLSVQSRMRDCTQVVFNAPFGS